MEKTYSYLNFFKKLYKEQDRISLYKAGSLDGLLFQRKELTDELKDILCMNQLEMYKDFLDEQVCAEEIEMVKEDGYIRKKYRIETLPQVFMPFYLLIPDSIKEGVELAAMIAIPAHGANKDSVAGVINNDEVKNKLTTNPNECYGKKFAQMGYVVLCPDPPGYGERVEEVPSEDNAFIPGVQKSVLGSSCKNLSQTAEALGLSFQGLVLWDMMRLVDFAVKQNFIDSSRIGCAGFSGGGLYTLWLAAMDERIKLSVISGYIHGYYDSILNTHLCPCNYIPNLWRKADVCDIASLIAPRYLYMENGKLDILNGARGILDPIEQAEQIKKVYAIYGKKDRIQYQPFDGKHEWYGGCYEFVAQNL